jgi:hypothetical protein
MLARKVRSEQPIRSSADGDPACSDTDTAWADHRRLGAARDEQKEKEMKLTRANLFALYVSVGAAATLASPALATAETPAIPGLPVQPCLASSSLPGPNPFPCPAGGTAAPASGQPAGSGGNGAAGANGSAAPATNGAAGANASAGAGVKGHVKVKAHLRTRRRHNRVRHSRHTRRHASRRHH